MLTRRGALLAVVWLAGAGLATAVGMLAVLLVRDQVGDPATSPLSASEVSRSLPTARPAPTRAATRTPRPRTPPPQAPTTRPVTPVGRTFGTAGGSVSVECTGTRPRLVYALPAPGWSVDEQEVEEGRVEVRFRAEQGEARVRVGCVGGRPVRQDD